MNVLEWLSHLPSKYHVIIGLLFTAVIGYIDFVTGYELRMELFYLIPISYAAWFVGRRFGVLLSILSIITIVYSDILAGKKYTSFTIEFWNGAIYFVFYVIVTLLLKLRVSLQSRKNLIEELDSVLKQNEELSAMLPICSKCKKFRDDPEYRQTVESYLSSHTKGEFIHNLCKECAAKL